MSVPRVASSFQERKLERKPREKKKKNFFSFNGKSGVFKTLCLGATSVPAALREAQLKLPNPKALRHLCYKPKFGADTEPRHGHSAGTRQPREARSAFCPLQEVFIFPALVFCMLWNADAWF